MNTFFSQVCSPAPAAAVMVCSPSSNIQAGAGASGPFSGPQGLNCVIKTGAVPLFSATYFSLPPNTCFRLFNNAASLVGLVSVTASGGRRTREGLSKLITSVRNFFRKENHTESSPRAREETIGRSSRVINLQRDTQREGRQIRKDRALPIDANQIKNNESLGSSQVALFVCVFVGTVVVFLLAKRMVRSFRLIFSKRSEKNEVYE